MPTDGTLFIMQTTGIFFKASSKTVSALRDTELIFSLSVQKTISTCGTDINSPMVQSNKGKLRRDYRCCNRTKNGGASWDNHALLCKNSTDKRRKKFVCRSIYDIVMRRMKDINTWFVYGSLSHKISHIFVASVITGNVLQIHIVKVWILSRDGHEIARALLFKCF